MLSFESKNVFVNATLKCLYCEFGVIFFFSTDSDRFALISLLDHLSC